MEIKDAIDILNYKKPGHWRNPNHGEIDEIIKLLKEFDKYKKIIDIPQPIKKNITIEIEANTERQLDWVKDYLKTHFEEITKSVGNFDQLKDGNIKINIKEEK